MTKRSDELEEVLKELRAEHREITAPDALEARLLAAMRAAKPVEAVQTPAVSIWNWRWFSGWGWAMATMVLLGVGLVVWGVSRDTRGPVQQAGVKTNSNIAPEQPQEVATIDTRPAEHDPVQETVRPTERRRRGEVTAFMEVPGSEGLPAPMESSIVRVKMAKGDLRQYGIDVPPAATNELIHADLYVGEDGLPRAIRLVR
jgi:hypothetical protein